MAPAPKSKKTDFANLPPLVPKGEDRDEIIEELVRKWATPIDNHHKQFILNDVALVDGNDNATIDLGQLLKKVNDRIQIPNRQKPVYNIQLTLKNCRVDLCNAANQSICFHVNFSECLLRNAKFHETEFRGLVWFNRAEFGGDALFGRAQFREDAYFRATEFGRAVRFEGAVFGGDTQFEGAEFRDAAWFNGVEFGGKTRFEMVKFRWGACFTGARFRWSTCFEGAVFCGGARFDRACFHFNSRFKRAEFGGDARFEGAEFGGEARFDWAEFGGDMYFENATNKLPLQFISTRFSDSQIFADHAFHTTRFRSNSQNSATFGRPLPKKRLPRLWHRFYTKGNAKHNWSLARGFGELTILTRASTSGLVFVPILAAVWPGVRALVQHYAKIYGYEDFLPPNMPDAWGMLFFAALFAMFGRVIYQSSCPEEVRERSRVDVMNEEMDAFRANRAEEGDRRLDEAISAIEEAGKNEYLRWFRHQNLVSHRGRTVWIPSKIEDFKYDRDDPTKIPPKWDDDFNEEPPSDDNVKPQLAEAVMSQTSREDITIQAGAGAWYDIISRQNRVQARIALWCYTLGVILVGVVIWEQAISILQEMGWQELTDDRARQLTLWLLAIIAGLLVFWPPLWSNTKERYQNWMTKRKNKSSLDD